MRSSASNLLGNRCTEKSERTRPLDPKHKADMKLAIRSLPAFICFLIDPQRNIAADTFPLVLRKRVLKSGKFVVSAQLYLYGNAAG